MKYPKYTQSFSLLLLKSYFFLLYFKSVGPDVQNTTPHAEDSAFAIFVALNFNTLELERYLLSSFVS